MEERGEKPERRGGMDGNGGGRDVDRQTEVAEGGPQDLSKYV